MTVSSKPLAVARASQRRVPDFFIVGHAKCGTTALYEMLRGHPQIYMPERKEPQFFARNRQPPAPDASRFAQTGRGVETLEDYLSLFAAAKPEQRVGEASTFYLWSRAAPRRIAEAQPGARIIAILREPANFIRSVHLQTLQNHAESEKDLRKAIALEDERRAGRSIPTGAHWPETLMYTDRVRYVDQLRRYHAVFPREQVLILIYEDFKRDNETTVRRVLRFLEVDDAHPIELLEANPTIGVRSTNLVAVRRAVLRGEHLMTRAARETLKGLTTKQLRRVLLYPAWRRVLYTHAPAPDERLMNELRARFQPEVVALSQYLDRDLLSLWGYDGVA